MEFRAYSLSLFSCLSKLYDLNNNVSNNYNIKYITMHIYVIKIIFLDYDYYIQYKKNLCFFM